MLLATVPGRGTGVDEDVAGNGMLRRNVPEEPLFTSLARLATLTALLPTVHRHG